MRTRPEMVSLLFTDAVDVLDIPPTCATSPSSRTRKSELAG